MQREEGFLFNKN